MAAAWSCGKSSGEAVVAGEGAQVDRREVGDDGPDTRGALFDWVCGGGVSVVSVEAEHQREPPAEPPKTPMRSGSTL